MASSAPTAAGSPSVTVVKNEVGGSWRESPATTTCRAREMADTASAGGTCEASSNTTTSNHWPGGSTDATTSGLITQHGRTAVTRSGQRVTRSRSGASRRARAPSARR